jgi:hypothetical protein
VGEGRLVDGGWRKEGWLMEDGGRGYEEEEDVKRKRM